MDTLETFAGVLAALLAFDVIKEWLRAHYRAHWFRQGTKDQLKKQAAKRLGLHR